MDYTRFYAGRADKTEGRVTSSPACGREVAHTAPEPYGVVGITITWNGPLVSIGVKVRPVECAQADGSGQLLISGGSRTQDVGRINRLAPRLQAGGVYVNGASPVVGCELPFGGVGSGIGRATALALAARGARIAASDIAAARANETAHLVVASPFRAWASPT